MVAIKVSRSGQIFDIFTERSFHLIKLLLYPYSPIAIFILLIISSIQRIDFGCCCLPVLLPAFSDYPF